MMFAADKLTYFLAGTTVAALIYPFGIPPEFAHMVSDQFWKQDEAYIAVGMTVTLEEIEAIFVVDEPVQ